MSVLKRRMFQNGGQADSPAVNLQAYAANLNDGTKTAREIFDAVNQYASSFGVSGLSLAEVEEMLPAGELHPNEVHLPGIFVQRIVLGQNYEKRIEQKTTI